MLWKLQYQVYMAILYNFLLIISLPNIMEWKHITHWVFLIQNAWNWKCLRFLTLSGCGKYLDINNVLGMRLKCKGKKFICSLCVKDGNNLIQHFQCISIVGYGDIQLKYQYSRSWVTRMQNSKAYYKILVYITAREF